MGRFNCAMLLVALSSVIVSPGCQVIDTEKIVKTDVDLKEIVGLLAGFGTTFAAFPDLLAMLKRRSSEGVNPWVRSRFCGSITDC